MAVNYDDVIKQNKRNLTRAQIQALAKAANKYSAENAGNRADALASLRNQYDTGYRGLQNMGLAGGLEAQATSGEVPRLKGGIQDAFDKYNATLSNVEHQRLTALGTKYANATKRARAEAALKQQQAALAAAERAEVARDTSSQSAREEKLAMKRYERAVRQAQDKAWTAYDTSSQSARDEKLALKRAEKKMEQMQTAYDTSSQSARDEKMAINRAVQEQQREMRRLNAAAELLGVSMPTVQNIQALHEAEGRLNVAGANAANSTTGNTPTNVTVRDNGELTGRTKGPSFKTQEQLEARRDVKNAEAGLAEYNGRTPQGNPVQAKYDAAKKKYEEEESAWNQKVVASEHYEDKSQFKVQSGSTSASNLKRGINTNMTDTASNKTNVGSTNKYAPQGTTYVRDARDNRTPLNRADEPESLVRARNEFELADMQLNAPDAYNALNIISNRDQYSTAAFEKAVGTLADYNMKQMGFKTPSTTDKEYAREKNVAPGIQKILDQIDSERLARDNAIQTKTLGDRDYYQEFVDDLLKELKDTYGVTEKEARELAGSFKKDRDARSEYNYYKPGMVAQLQHQGEKPVEPVNKEETDENYRIINGLPAIRLAGLGGAGNTATFTVQKYMSQEQKDQYNAIYEKDGIEAANQYFEDITPYLNIERAMQDEAYYQEFAKEHPVLADLRSVGANVLWNMPAMTEMLLTGAENMFSDEQKYFDLYSDASFRSARADTIRTTRSEQILNNTNRSEWVNGVYNFAYQTGMSMADSATAMAFAYMGAPAVVDALFFSSAGISSYKDAKARGATQDQAMLFGAMSGAAEAVFEHASIEHFLKMDYVGKGALVKNLRSQMLAEGSEEVSTALADLAADELIMMDKSQLRLDAKKYMRDDPNISEEDAYKQAYKDQLWDIVMSGVGGAVSGGLFGLGGAVLNEATYNREGAKIKAPQMERMTTLAELLGGESKEVLDKYNEKQTNRNAGELQAVVEKSMKEMFSGGENALMDYEANEGVVDKAAAGAVILSGDRMSDKMARSVLTVMGNEALESMGYDASNPESFAKSYNARLDQYNIKSKTDMLRERAAKFAEARKGSAYQQIGRKASSAGVSFAGSAREGVMSRKASATYNAARNNAAERVWANPEQGLTLTSEGRTVPAMPGNMTAISFAEQERNNFQTRASATTGSVTYAVAGMQTREGLSNEQTLSEIKKGLTKEARQKAEVYEKLSSALGIPMVIHDVMTGTNGFIDESGNMHVVLSGKQSVLRVAAHELTHWGKNKNASAYSALREHLINEVGDERFDRMLKQKAKEYGIDLSTEKGKALADDEVCAELCERMLSNEDALEKFAMKDTAAAKSLKDHLVKILNAIKAAFKNASNRDFGDSWSDLIQGQETIESWIQMLQGAVDKAERQAQTNEGQIAQTAGITASEQDAMLEDIHEVTETAKESVAEVKAETKAEQKAEAKAERDPLKARRYVAVTSTSNRSQGRSFEGGKSPKGMTNLAYKMDNAESFGRKLVTGSMSDYANFGYTSYFGNLDGDAYGYSKNTWRSDNGRAIMDSQAAVSSAADLKQGNAFLDDVVRMNFLSSEELGNAGSMEESDVANRAPVELPALTQEQKQAAADVAKMLAKGKNVVLQLPVSDNFDGMSRAALGAIFEALPARKRTGISFATGLTAADISKAGDVNLIITDESQHSAGDDMTWTSLATTTADQIDDVIAEHSVDIFEHDMSGYVRDIVSKGVLTKSEMSDLMDTMDKAITMVKAHRAVLDFGFQLSEEAQNDSALAEKEIKEAKQGRAYLPYKQNADPHYKLALDFSTLCRKRVLLQSIQERLQAKLGRALSQEETVAIRLELQNLQRNNKEEFGKIEVACALCYVEAARLKSPKVINTFLNNTKAEMQNYFAKKNPASKQIIEGMQQQWKVDHGYAPDTTKKEMSSSDVTAFNTFSKTTREQFESDNAAEQVTVDRATRLTKGEKVMIGGIEFPGRETFLSASWLEKLKGVEPDIFYAFTDKVRSATRSKAQETDTFYARGDIDMVTEGILNYANAESGFRHQSWSDFVPTHLLDTMASVIEMSTRDAKMHAYTKVPSMVRLLGRTGMMLNMSLIPAGNGIDPVTGKLVWDSVEGMPWQTMYDLRKKFPNTAGNIAIGVSDEQIKLLLDSPDIDYVIPYHASGMNKNMRGYLDIRAWSEYTSSQNEKSNKRGKKGATPELAEWFDEKAAAKATDGVAFMRAASEKYLQLCYERNLVPKFSQYLTNNGDGSYSLKEGYENYWKMLTDRKMVNQVTGKVIIQQAVKPMFDQATVIDILQDRVNDPAIQQQAKAADLVTEKFSGWQANQNNASAEAIAEAKKMRDRTNAITAQKTAEESGMRYSLDTDAIREAMPDDSKVRYSLDQSEHRKAAIKPKGKNPVRDIDVPETAANGKRVSDFTRSALESNKFTDDMVEQLMPAVEAGEWGGYTRLTNEEAMSRAKDYIAKHQTVKAQQDFHDMVMSGQYNVTTRALGLQLLTEAAQRGDKLAVLDIATDLRILATDAGQSVQIFSVLKDLGGVGSAYYMNRVVERLNTKYADKIAAGDMNEISVSDELMNRLERAQSTREVQAAEKAISKEIADQLPLTWADRLSNWRYMAMLANPTTHVRNLFGNLLMGGMVSAKDVVATAIERAAIKDKSAWTHAVLSKADRQMFGKIAEDSYLDNEALLRGNGKFSFENEIKQNMRSFDTKALNAIAQFNFNKLEQEDMWFIKPAYKNALMQYMKAQGYTVKDGKVGKTVDGEFKEMTKSQKAQAFEYASEQAWKATFHDASALADMLNKVSKMNTASRLIVEGVMPFKKTPINIAKRGVEYSPAGIVMGLVQLGRDVKNGKVTTAHAVDNLASGLTGTTLMALGALLAKMKLIKAEGDDDDKKKSTYLSDTGDQTYSLKIGKYSFGLSALAPATIPLFMGAALWEKISGQDENLDLSTITDVVSGALNPFMEMSFMSSLNSALKNYGNEGIGGALGNSLLTAAENYGSQYLPTLTSKLGQFFDPTVRTTKSSATSPIGSGMDYYARSLVKKVPGLEATLQPDINVWGRATKKDSFAKWALDFANKFILPANVKVANRDAVDDELIRVLESTGNTDFLPSDGPKKFKVKGEDYKMNAAQYTQYSEDRGTASYAALKETMSLNAYQTADDETKASMLSNALEAAQKQVNSVWKEKLGAFEPKQTVEATAVTAPAQEKPQESVKDIQGDYSDPALYKVAAQYPKAYDKAAKAKSQGVSPDTFLDIYEKRDNYLGENLAQYTRQEIMNSNLTTKQKELMDDLIVSDKGWNPDYSSQTWFDISQLDKTKERKRYNQAKEGSKIGVKPETYLKVYTAWANMHGSDKQKQAKQYLDSLAITAPAYDYFWYTVFEYTKHPSKVK